MSVDRIKTLLGSGLSNEVVASATGVTPAYISQLLADEKFAQEVTELRVVALTEYSRRDHSIDGIEDKLIQKLEESIDTGLIYKPTDVLRAFAVINAAKRRGVPAHTSGVHITQNIVQLQLPAALQRKFITSKDNEVVEIDGETMVPMTAHTLLTKLKNVTPNDPDNKYAKASRFLPPAAAEAAE